MGRSRSAERLESCQTSSERKLNENFLFPMYEPRVVWEIQSIYSERRSEGCPQLCIPRTGSIQLVPRRPFLWLCGAGLCEDKAVRRCAPCGKSNEWADGVGTSFWIDEHVAHQTRLSCSENTFFETVFLHRPQRSLIFSFTTSYAIEQT